MKAAKKLPWIILAILALAAFLRLYNLGNESLWLDEAVNVLLCKEGPGSVIDVCVDDGVHPPFYFLLLNLWILIFGQSEVAIRLLSALLGIIAVFLTYKVGCEVCNRRVGLIASLFLAISSFAVYYSQEVLPYSMLLVLTLLSFILFLRVLRAEKPQKTHFLFYALVNVLLCYTHLFGVFTVGAQVLYYLFYRRRYAKARRVFWGTQAVTLAFFSPWIYVLVTNGILGDTAGGLAWIPEPSFSVINSITRALTGAGFIEKAWGAFLMWFFLSLCLAGVFYFPKALQWRGSGEEVQNTGKPPLASLFAGPMIVLVLLWLLFPFFLSLILSFAYKPMMVDRYLIGVIPALCLLAACGIENVASFIGVGGLRAKVTAVMLIAIVAAVSLVGLHSYYVDYHKLDWRAATAFIEQDAQPGDAIVFYPDYEHWPFDYYYEGEHELAVISYKEILEDEGAAAVNERLWLVQLPASANRDINVQRELYYRFGDEALIRRGIFEPLVVYLFDI